MKHLILAATLTALAGGAMAEDLPKLADFPERAVTFTSPYKPGGGSDGVTRAMASAFTVATKIDAPVVNKPGGAGVPGTADFLAQPADGYGVLQGYDAVVTNFVLGKAPFNPVTDLEPLAIAHITFNQLFIRPDETRFTDFASMVAYAKANPGAMSVANVGDPGSMERIMMTKLENALGFTTKQVPYPAPAERYAALIGGEVDVLFEQPGDVVQFTEAGEMKPVFSFLKESPELFADIPNLTEVGADFTPLFRFRGFWTNPEVSEERKEWLESALAAAWNTDDMQSYNASKFMDLVPAYRDRDGAAALIQAAIETYTEAYKELGLIE